MTTAPLVAEATRIPLNKIHARDNVRTQLLQEDIDALAGSIDLLGVLQPVIVTPLQNDPDGFEYTLVAGYTRYAACAQLGYHDIPATVREADDADTAAAQAAENVTRKQINAYEEAIAVAAMLEKGLTEQGAAQALGWPVQRVAARVKLLELPVKAQAMVGTGILPLSYVETLCGIRQVSREVVELLVDFLDANPDQIPALQRDIAYLLSYALRESDLKVFVATLTVIRASEIEQLRLGKKVTTEYEELCELHKKVSYYSYGTPEVRFADAEVDQARAAGVLIEGVGSPLIVDKSLYRELVKQAIARQLENTRVSATEKAEQRKVEQTQLKAQRAADPETELRRDHGRKMRSIAEQAHGANTDLGWALRNNLASVDPGNIDVARFFVGALLESGSSYTNPDADSDRVTRLAMTGIRLVIDEFRKDVTKIKKNGERGALRIDYGSSNDSEAPRAWLWRFIEGGKSAGDLYGRALVVIAAEHYASRLVLPSSQQHPPLGWGRVRGRPSRRLRSSPGRTCRSRSSNCRRQSPKPRRSMRLS